MTPTRTAAASRADNDHFEECLASRPFLFVVGEEKKEYHLHKELVGQLSPALNALVNGRMKEAAEGRVEWPELETDTFLRFAKYAYSRDYNEAEPEILPTKAVDHEQESPGSPPWPGDDDVAEHEDQMASDWDEEEEEDSEESDEDEDEDEDDGYYGMGRITYPAGWMAYYTNTDMEPDASDQSSTVSNAHDTSYEHGEDVPEDAHNPRPEKNELLFRLRSGEPCELPYSLLHFQDAWEEHLKSLRVRRIRRDDNLYSDIGMPSRKRRRVDPDKYKLKAPKNPKYNSVRHFSLLKLPAPPRSASSSSSVHAYQWRPRPNTSANESYEGVFLSHARLYILADKYGVEGLRALALHRLHCSLLHFTIYPERVPDLVALVDVIYSNTVEEDPARTVLAMFFGCVVEHTKDSDAFRSLMRRVGDFADDLVQEMTNRLG